ncbi:MULTISPECIES: hypothetical protein [Persicobacter]|uniref:Uncharacterized protein n=1 Tax=Persicobacter diffluens TaxID=981 RepID=A0AAN4VXV5_9BACT|nr:hypothetical protein [Persicobacter sp. CCB-QB2]GJM60842.1 hypothetical protein PEDI_13940 [Persicobacter diffluens]
MEDLPEFERKYADYLSEKDLKKIKALEKETGKTLLAYYTPPKPAQLTDEELKKVQNLEKKLCVRIVAYDYHTS